jgi:hypothetical protein
LKFERVGFGDRGGWNLESSQGLGKSGRFPSVISPAGRDERVEKVENVENVESLE